MTPILGGVMADKWLGKTRAVVLGASMMAIGHFLMAFDASFLLALLMLVLGVGLLSVSMALTIVSAWSIKRRIKVIAFASAMSGLVLLALVRTNQPSSAAVLLVLLGAGLGVLTPVAWGVLQEVAPGHMLGRVLAFYTLCAMGAAMGGITLFGWITGQFGAPTAIVTIGFVMGGSGLSAWRFLENVSDRPPRRETPLVRDQA